MFAGEERRLLNTQMLFNIGRRASWLENIQETGKAIGYIFQITLFLSEKAGDGPGSENYSTIKEKIRAKRK